MSTKRIEIGELHLRLPGMSREEAQQLAQEVARNLLEKLGRESQSLGSLELKVSVPSGTPRNRLVDSIVRSILGSLR